MGRVIQKSGSNHHEDYRQGNTRGRRLALGAILLGTGLGVSPAGWSQGAPTITSVTPTYNATGVAVNSTLVFVFNQAMDTSVEVIPSVPPFLVGNLELSPSDQVPMLEGQWSADGRTLTCTPSSDFPPNKAITWKLNPSGSFMPFKSAGGTAVATVTGTFTTGAGGGGGGETAPKLVSADPADGATVVPVTASVVFVFDQAMQKNPALGGFPPLVQGAVAWSGTGITASKFSYVWSTDGKTLTCDYSGDLPGNTAITWQLNPPGAAIQLQNEDGEALASNTYLGEFTTGQGSGGGGDCDPSGVPTTWGSYTISKYGHYNQSSAADPVPDAQEPFMFYSGVVAPDAGPAVTAGSVTLPNSTSKTLEALGLFLYFTDAFPTEAALETAYPSGNYVLRFTQTGLAERVIPMAMNAGTLPVPKIANYAEAQAVNAGQNFTLRWNAFTGAGAQDFLSVSISDGVGNVVFQAPDRCVPRELPVTATSIVIPAGTFQSNRTYSASLNFSRVFYTSTNTVPEMGGYGTVGKMTDFTIKTGTGGGGTADPARFTGYRLLPNGDPQMDLTGTALKSYTIERTADLRNPVWQNVGTVTMNPLGAGLFQDTQAGKTLPLFYRAVAN